MQLKANNYRQSVTVPDCKKAELCFTGKKVYRGSVTMGHHGAVVCYARQVIPLALCKNCQRSVRVLPIELLPRKIYGIDVIELGIRRYLNGETGYRPTTSGIVIAHGPALAHTTLHRWISGIGEKVLDRNPILCAAYPPAASAALAQSERLGAPDLINNFLNTTVSIAPAKYRSEHRYDQLVAVAKLVVLMSLLFDHEQASLLNWNNLLLQSFFVPAWNFPTGFSRTPMQQVHPP
jgi:hypothetical protein